MRTISILGFEHRECADSDMAVRHGMVSANSSISLRKCWSTFSWLGNTHATSIALPTTLKRFVPTVLSLAR